MVYFSPLIATAILSFGATTLAAPTNEWVHPIYYGDVPAAKAAQDSGAPAPRVRYLYPEDLEPFSDAEVTPSNSTDSVSARGIIGNDDRVLWSSLEYPYIAMGRVSASSGGLCSGALVGRRIVATAQHCIPPSGASVRFQPSYYDGERLGGSQVTAIISMAQGTGSCGQQEDWALFVLADPMGDNLGYLGAKVIDCDGQKNSPIFFHLGYPGDHGAVRPYCQEGISVSRCADCEPGGPLETDADAVPGQSGGPLWLNENGSRYQYGVLSGTSAIGSGFASGANFVNAIAKARNDFP